MTNFFLCALPQLTKFESDSDAETNFGDGTPSVSSKKPLTDAPHSSPTPCHEENGATQTSQPIEKLTEDKVNGYI